jgi:hypothetical protein
LLLSEGFAKRLVNSSQTAQHLAIAEQVCDTRFFFERRRNDHEELSARLETR